MIALGVDFGTKAIGLAVGESEHGITTARAPIRASGGLKTDAAAIMEIARKEEADAIVVGVPRNQPGLSARMENICLQLADRLREAGMTVFTVDEAMTSAESELGLSHVSKRSRKTLAHGEAARLILERFFDAQA